MIGKNIRSKIVVDMVFLSLLIMLSMLYFHKVVFNDFVLVHGDLRFALTAWQHLTYHLKSVYIHAPKTPILLLIYILSFVLGDIVALKFSIVLVLFVASSFVYFANKYFITRISSDTKPWKIALSSFIGTMVFMFNPWTINKIHHHYWLVLSLASSYLLLAEIDKAINHKPTVLDALIISLLTTFVATQVQGLIIYLCFLLALYIGLFTVIDKKNFVDKVCNKRTLAITIIIAIINLFWILPQLSVLLIGTTKPGSYGIVVENVDTLSRRASLLNVFRASSLWIWGGYGRLATTHYALIVNGIDVWRLASLLPVVLVGVSILVGLKKYTSKTSKRYIIYFASLFVLSITLSTGSYYSIIGGLYRWVFLNAPFGWVIRDPYKNVGLVIISISIFISILVHAMLGKAKSSSFTSAKALLLLFIIALSLIWGWPALTGDLNGHLKPLAYPEDLEKTINYLRTNFDYRSNILWYPLEVDKAYLAYEDVPQLSTSNLNVFTVSNYQLARYIESSLEDQHVNGLIQLLKTLSAKYVIARRDVIESREKGRLLTDIELLENALKPFKKIKFGNFTIYDLQHIYENIRIYPRIVYSLSPDLRKDFMFNSTVSFIFPVNNSVYFICPYYFNSPFKDYLLKLSSLHYNPSKYWSLGSLYGGWLKDFNRYLMMYGLDNWQSDFGYGLVFTSGSKIVPSNIKLSRKDLLVSYDFNSVSDLRKWQEYTPRIQFKAIQELRLSNGALEALLLNSTWGWKEINSPLIPVDSTHVYRFVIRIRGIHAHGVHVKIAEFDSHRKVVDIKYVTGVGDGTFNWRQVVFDYVPSSHRVRYVQLQIWHGCLANKPLPNIIMIDYVRIYDITKYAKHVTLDMPFNVPKADSYRIFIRYFENQKGGAIRIYLDGELVAEINTTSQLNRFVWRDLGIYRLESGRHVLTLENVYGFNAVNVFAIMPIDEYERLIKEFERLLENKTIIYLFEAESDMFRKNAEVINNVNASNGEGLLLGFGGSAWQKFEVIKSGYYMLAIRLNGSAVVKLDNKTFNVSSKGLGIVYIGPVYLSKGINKLVIKPRVYKVASWTFTNESVVELWKMFTPEKQFKAIQKVVWDHRDDALQVELYNSTWGWKTIRSPLIPAKPGYVYIFRFKVKALNGYGVHFKIVEYDENGRVLHVTYAGRIGNGSFGWKDVECVYTPRNESVAYLQLQIWHGHLTSKPLPNIIWVKDVEVYRYNPVYLDVVWIYSVNSPGSRLTIEDLFRVREEPAKIISYKRIDPTLWKAKVVAKKSFMLVFAEAYDPLWEARVYKDGRLVEKVGSVPVYSVINGFWINESGNLTIVIRYVPQDWFELGLKISATTFVLCIFYLIYDWRKNKNDKWIKHVHDITKYFIHKVFRVRV